MLIGTLPKLRATLRSVFMHALRFDWVENSCRLHMNGFAKVIPDDQLLPAELIDGFIFAERS